VSGVSGADAPGGVARGSFANTEPNLAADILGLIYRRDEPTTVYKMRVLLSQHRERHIALMVKALKHTGEIQLVKGLGWELTDRGRVLAAARELAEAAEHSLSLPEPPGAELDEAARAFREVDQ